MKGAPVTYDALKASGHRCNYLCRGEYVHAEIVYTTNMGDKEKFIHDYSPELESGDRLIDVFEAKEVLDWKDNPTHFEWSQGEPEVGEKIRAWVCIYEFASDKVGSTINE